MCVSHHCRTASRCGQGRPCVPDPPPPAPSDPTPPHPISRSAERRGRTVGYPMQERLHRVACRYCRDGWPRLSPQPRPGRLRRPCRHCQPLPLPALWQRTAPGRKHDSRPAGWPARTSPQQHPRRAVHPRWWCACTLPCPAAKVPWWPWPCLPSSPPPQPPPCPNLPGLRAPARPARPAAPRRADPAEHLPRQLHGRARGAQRHAGQQLLHDEQAGHAHHHAPHPQQHRDPTARPLRLFRRKAHGARVGGVRGVFWDTFFFFLPSSRRRTLPPPPPNPSRPALCPCALRRRLQRPPPPRPPLCHPGQGHVSVMPESSQLMPNDVLITLCNYTTANVTRGSTVYGGAANNEVTGFGV